MIKEIFQKIGSAAVIVSFLAGVLFTANFSTPVGAATNKIPDTIAVFETSLQTSIGTSDTTMTLVSATYNDGNSTLASSTYAFVLDAGTSNEEFVVADCTATACTNMTRGLDGLSGTTTITALKKAHRRGASVKITDGPSLLILNRILQGVDNFPFPLSYQSDFTIASTSRQIVAAYQAFGMANTASSSALATILGRLNTWAQVNTFTLSPVVPYSTASSSAASVGYVNAAAFAGGVQGSETVAGVYELSTGAEAAAGTSLGGTSARLVLPGSLATSTSQTAQNSVVITKSDGKIDQSFLTNTHYVFSSATTTSQEVASSTIHNLNVDSCIGCGSTYQTEFLVSGVWTKPQGVRNVYIIAVGAGGGGGAGSEAVAGNYGGTGGGGGSTVIRQIPAALLPSTVWVQVGTSTPGAAVSDAIGGDGGNGSPSFFGASPTQNWVFAGGGGGGKGGQPGLFGGAGGSWIGNTDHATSTMYSASTTPVEGQGVDGGQGGRRGVWGGGSGAGYGDTAGAGGSWFGSAGGGTGGSGLVNSGNGSAGGCKPCLTIAGGGAGGSGASQSAGGAGVSATSTSPTFNSFIGGSGGGGGGAGSNTGQTGGAGGDGGYPGGGGGGGAGTDNGGAGLGGAGGRGAPGYVLIISW